MTVNINRDSSCGNNVAHLGGQSKVETGSDEEGEKKTDAADMVPLDT